MPKGITTKLKPCKICGEIFLPEQVSQRFCKKDHYVACPVCGKQIIWNSMREVPPCSRQCSREKTKRDNIAKYGVDHPMKCKEVQENFKAAMKEKYGVEHALQADSLKQKASETIQERFGTEWALSNPEVKAKANQTMIERYGAKTTFESEILKAKVAETNMQRYGSTNPRSSDEIKGKSMLTCISKYGVPNPMQDEDILQSAIKTRLENHSGIYWTEEMTDKFKSTCIERYGVDNPSKSEDIQERIRNTCLEKYGVTYGCLLPQSQCNKYRISSLNRKMADDLLEKGINSDFEFYLEGKMYDLKLQDSNVLIEINPSYTHNIAGNHWSPSGIPKDYHLKKSKIAEGNGYRCIHIFEWDDKDKIIELLMPKKKLYARNMEIFKLKIEVVDEFLKQFHLQGTCRGQLLCLGLVKDGTLYQVMTFGKSRYDKSHDIELLRLCTRAGYTVVGGASRLFKCATRDFELHNIISYCDRSKFTGKVYEEIGMTLIRETPPQIIWSKGQSKITSNLLRKEGYDHLFNTNYGKGTSNEELMLQNKWLPVPDCGQLVYSFK